MTPSIWQIVIVIALILIFFVRGKISSFLKELGKGTSSFKAGVEEGKDEEKKAVEKKKAAPKSKTSKK
jgi:Sec-independent protein translocase protein TatA